MSTSQHIVDDDARICRRQCVLRRAWPPRTFIPDPPPHRSSPATAELNCGAVNLAGAVRRAYTSGARLPVAPSSLIGGLSAADDDQSSCPFSSRELTTGPAASRLADARERTGGGAPYTQRVAQPRYLTGLPGPRVTNTIQPASASVTPAAKAAAIHRQPGSCTPLRGTATTAIAAHNSMTPRLKKTRNRFDHTRCRSVCQFCHSAPKRSVGRRSLSTTSAHPPPTPQRVAQPRPHTASRR